MSKPLATRTVADFKIELPLLGGPSSMLGIARKDVTCRRRSISPGRLSGCCVKVEIVLGQGGTTAEGCRRIGVTEQTYCRWRREYGSLKVDQARRMKDLEKENLRFRRAVFDLTPDKLILHDERVSDPSGGSLVARMPREPSKPRAATALHRPSSQRDAGVRAAYMPGARPASVDAAQSGARSG